MVSGRPLTRAARYRLPHTARNKQTYGLLDNLLVALCGHQRTETAECAYQRDARGSCSAQRRKRMLLIAVLLFNLNGAKVNPFLFAKLKSQMMWAYVKKTTTLRTQSIGLAVSTV